MQSVDRMVRASVYRRMAEGFEAPTPGDVAGDTGLAVDTVARSLSRLADNHRLVLSSDRSHVVMAHPFSGVPTDYRSQIGEMSWWANCGWDAFAILALLGDGRVLATSDDGSESVWTVEGGRVAPSGVVNFVVPARHFWDDIGFT